MLDALSADWSRPYKIVRVLQALGMEVPKRLRRERLALLLEALSKARIEARLADGASIDLADSPGIEAKIRLRLVSGSGSAGHEFGYEVISRIPVGGMAACFKVRDGDGVERFLKKVPIAGIQGDALKRELEVYAKLERAAAEHVLRVVEHRRDGEFIALVMEFAEGGTLDEYREQCLEVSPGEAKEIAFAIAAGLRELHLLGIVHRDLKPLNVLRAGGTWKLADFGISKNLARLLTQGPTFQRCGTRGYTPPEQWAGREAHPSADVYAFGKVLVFLLTGETDIDYLYDHPRWAELVRECTHVEPEARLTVPQIEERLASL